MYKAIWCRGHAATVLGFDKENRSKISAVAHMVSEYTGIPR